MKKKYALDIVNTIKKTAEIVVSNKHPNTPAWECLLHRSSVANRMGDDELNALVSSHAALYADTFGIDPLDPTKSSSMLEWTTRVQDRHFMEGAILVTKASNVKETENV